MNLKLVFTVLIISLANSIYSQTNGIAYYKKVSNKDFSKEKEINKDPQLKKMLRKSNSEIAGFSYKLLFSPYKAKYIEIQNGGLEEESLSKKIARVSSGYAGPYFYDFESNIIVQQQRGYLITKQTTDYDWTLTKEKIVINNLTCYKATTRIELNGRRGKFYKDIVAWYTINIPVPIGPDGFGGLPGLIIQLENDKITTTLTKVEFKEKLDTIQFPTKGKKITEKEFNELMKQMFEERGN